MIAVTQAERNNRENESHFREQPAEQNPSPVDSCATHFPTPVPHVERSAIIAIGDEYKPVVKTLLTSSGDYFRLTGDSDTTELGKSARRFGSLRYSVVTRAFLGTSSGGTIMFDLLPFSARLPGQQSTKNRTK